MVDRTNSKAFSLEVHVAKWVPYSKVRLQWKDDVEISDVYGATIVDGADGGDMLGVQLGPAVPFENKFQVMGSGQHEINAPFSSCAPRLRNLR